MVLIIVLILKKAGPILAEPFPATAKRRLAA
jgi:hypothetical protein